MWFFLRKSIDLKKETRKFRSTILCSVSVYSRIIQEYYRNIAVILQEYYRNITVILQEYYRNITGI